MLFRSSAGLHDHIVLDTLYWFKARNGTPKRLVQEVTGGWRAGASTRLSQQLPWAGSNESGDATLIPASGQKRRTEVAITRSSLFMDENQGD